MGRPRTFDRDEALDTALDAFCRTGYDLTSIAQLTDAIGIKAPSLYAAFGDKDRLFAEAAKRYVDRVREALDASLAEPTARAAVRSVLRAGASAWTEPGSPHGCLVLSEPRLADERARTRDALRARIVRGQAEGDVAASADAEALASFFGAVMAGMSARARDGAPRDELDASVELALAALP